MDALLRVLDAMEAQRQTDRTDELRVTVVDGSGTVEPLLQRSGDSGRLSLRELALQQAASAKSQDLHCADFSGALRPRPLQSLQWLLHSESESLGRETPSGSRAGVPSST